MNVSSHIDTCTGVLTGVPVGILTGRSARSGR